MTTATQAPAGTDTRDDRPELLALIALALMRLTRTWALLSTAQIALLHRLAALPPGTATVPRIRDALAEFNGLVGAFDRDARAFAERWAATDLPTAYRDGALRALMAARRDITLFRWTTNHQAALTALTAPLWGDLIRRITEAVRRAQAFARDAATAARKAQAIDTAALLEQHPLDTVVYANQARHPVAAWAAAALTWQAVAATNTGAALTARDELGAQWMQISDGMHCGWTSHQDTDQADGTLRTVDEAAAYPSAHPGCVRQLIPRPDLTGRTDITSGDPA